MILGMGKLKMRQHTRLVMEELCASARSSDLIYWVCLRLEPGAARPVFLPARPLPHHQSPGVRISISQCLYNRIIIIVVQTLDRLTNGACRSTRSNRLLHHLIASNRFIFIVFLLSWTISMLLEVTWPLANIKLSSKA